MSYFKKRKTYVIAITLLLALIIDLITKYFTEGATSSFIPGFIEIKSQHNTGAAWSMFSGHTWLLILISVLFLSVFVAYEHLSKHKKNLLYYISYGLILGGAIGNLIDRLFLGYVRDFLNFQFFNFPVFNIADVCLTVGVFLFCVFLLFVLPSLEKKTKNEIGIQ